MKHLSSRSIGSVLYSYVSWECPEDLGVRKGVRRKKYLIIKHNASALDALPHLTFTSLHGRYYHLQFTDGETEGWRDQEIFFQSSW